MKRIKERYDQVDKYNDKNISGCRVFGGEDLEFKDRQKLHRVQQNAWIKEQENRIEKRNEDAKEKERQYAEQTRATNKMRSMLEAEHQKKVFEMNLNTLDYNKKMAEEKRARERQQKQDEINLDLNNLKEAEESRQKSYNYVKSTLDERRQKY